MSVDPNPRLVSLAEVKNMLRKVEKDREGELIYEQRIALDHANMFARLPANKAADMIKELMKIEGMEETLAYKIADVLPINEGDVKAIFAKVRSAPKDTKQIVDIVNKYYVP